MEPPVAWHTVEDVTSVRCSLHFPSSVIGVTLVVELGEVDGQVGYPSDDGDCLGA